MQSRRFLFIPLAAVVMGVLAGLALAAGPPGYHPGPWPRTDMESMPLKGHNGDGTGGFCVSIIGREDLGTIDVKGFITDPVVRHQIGRAHV